MMQNEIEVVIRIPEIDYKYFKELYESLPKDPIFVDTVVYYIGNGTPLNEPFINKPCISESVCHEDKVKVLDKIRAEIMEDIENGVYDALHGDTYASTYLCGMRHTLEIIDKHISGKEEEGKNG